MTAWEPLTGNDSIEVFIRFLELKCDLKVFFFNSRIIVVQSEENPDRDTLNRSSTLTPSSSTTNPESEVQGLDLYILAGHEAMQLWNKKEQERKENSTIFKRKKIKANCYSLKSFILLPLDGAVFSATEQQVMKTVFDEKRLPTKKRIYVLLYQLNVPLRVKTIGRKPLILIFRQKAKLPLTSLLASIR